MHKIGILVLSLGFAFILLACSSSTTMSNLDYQEQLQHTIRQRFPAIGDNTVLFSIEYHQTEQITTTQLLDINKRTIYIIDQEDSTMRIVERNASNEEITSYEKCQETPGSLDISPQKAISILQPKYRIENSIALYRPYIVKIPELCRNVWIIMNRSEQYMVDASTGNIIEVLNK